MEVYFSWEFKLIFAYHLGIIQNAVYLKLLIFDPLCIAANGNLLASGNLCFRVFKQQSREVLIKEALQKAILKKVFYNRVFFAVFKTLIKGLYFHSPLNKLP